MAECMLLLHEEPGAFEGLSPDEIQQVVGEYLAWRSRLVEDGRLVGGEKLSDDGGRWLTRGTASCA
jgi:hypothetical protein